MKKNQEMHRHKEKKIPTKSSLEEEFFLAVSANQLDKVKKIASVCNVLEFKNSDFSRGIHIAAKAGYSGLVKYFIDSGSYVDAQNRNGATPLALALSEEVGRRDRKEVVDVLLGAGADPNYIKYLRNDYLTNLGADLLGKLMGGNKAVVRSLFEHGLDIFSLDGWTPTCKEDIELVMLYKKSSAKGIVLRTVLSENINLVDFVLQNKSIDVNEQDYFGISPLMLACYLKNFSIVDLLIKKGAKFSLCDKYKNNSLFYLFGTPEPIADRNVYSLSRKFGDYSVEKLYYLDMLAQKNSKAVNQVNKKGQSVLKLILDTANDELSEILLEQCFKNKSFNRGLMTKKPAADKLPITQELIKKSYIKSVNCCLLNNIAFGQPELDLARLSGDQKIFVLLEHKKLKATLEKKCPVIQKPDSPRKFKI